MQIKEIQIENQKLTICHLESKIKELEDIHTLEK